MEVIGNGVETTGVQEEDNFESIKSRLRPRRSNVDYRKVNIESPIIPKPKSGPIDEPRAPSLKRKEHDISHISHDKQGKVGWSG